MNIRRFRDRIIFVQFFLFILSYCSNSFAGIPDYISFSSAIFDVLQNDVTSLEGRIEYKANSSDWVLKPFAGFMANTDGAQYIYSGLYYEISITEFLSIIPSFASGFYFSNHSKNLYSLLEFRSQLEAIFILSEEFRMGISFNHMSNASLGDENPGVESLAFTIQVPVFW